MRRLLVKTSDGIRKTNTQSVMKMVENMAAAEQFSKIYLAWRLVENWKLIATVQYMVSTLIAYGSEQTINEITFHN